MQPCEHVILEVGIGVALLGGAWLLTRFVFRRREHALPDHHRFVLRVRHPGKESVLFGHGKEADRVITSVALTLVDDADHRIQIPAGLQLMLRDFNAGEWLEDADSPALMLLPNGPFWILDAPSWTDCAPIDEDGTRVVPRRDYVLTTTAPETDAHPILATMDAPLWDANLGTQSWTLPPRAARSTPIVVVSFADPYGGDQERSLIVDGAALVLGDVLLRTTDAPVSTSFPIVVARARVRMRRAQPTWKELGPLLRTLERPHVVIRGEALPKLADGFRVTARWSTETTEQIIDGQLDEVAAKIVDHLHARRACTPVSPPASFVVPAGSMLAYQRVASLAFDSLLADDRNQAIPTVPGQAGSAAEHARQLALSVPSSLVLQLLWASAAIRAHDADELPEEHWNMILDACDLPESALYRISPLLLYRFELDGAEERRTVLLASGGQPYRATPDAYTAWLSGLDLVTSDDS